MKKEIALKLLWDSCIHNEETKEAYEVLKNDTRPQGEWINTSPYDIEGECSLCCYLSNKCYNFCPNCGARMIGKEE